MYRSLGFYVGFKACALNDVVAGAVDAKDLVQERDKFFYAIRLMLNTMPCYFNVTLDTSDERNFISVESTDDNYERWLKDNYCSSLEPSEEDLDKAAKQADDEVNHCFDMVRDIITHYSMRFEGNLLVHLDD